MSLALAIGTTGCSTTSGPGADGTGPSPAGGATSDDPLVALGAICRETDERITALPTPPEQIAAADWATEVGRAYRDEAMAVDRFFVEDDDTRRLVGTYVDTSEELAARWGDLADALRTGADTVDAIRTELTELALGRDDTAAALGVDECRRSASEAPATTDAE